MVRAIQLFHRRWSVPVVGTLYASGGLRFGELLTRLGASRDTLSETLASLIANGVVEHAQDEAGRQRYVLNAHGRSLGEAAVGAVGAVREAGIRRLALKKWPMLVVVAVGRGVGRYGILQKALPGITPRSLTMALKDLQNENLLTRTVGEGYPPTTAYKLTERGEQLFPAMDRIVAIAEQLPGEDD